MKTTLFTLLAILFLISCKKESQQLTISGQTISGRVQYQEDGEILKLKSGKFNYEIPHSKLPYKKVVLLNASLIGYFTELGLEDNIIGVSSPEYIYSEKIKNGIKNGNIADVGNEQKYDVEKILALKPDAVFTNYIATFGNTYELLKKNGIEIIFLDEYLENDPLGKSKYLLVFGRLFGKEEKSGARFQEIKKSYDSLKSLVKNETKPVVISNEMYGGQWFMPGGKTAFAKLLEDAGAAYILKGNLEEKAIPMSFEEVFVKAENARFWMNAGNHRNKNSLLSINPNYAKMQVFQNGKIYAVTAREQGKSNDYFESGVVRADLILKDYIRIFHPHLLPNYSLTYLKELK